MNSTEPKDKYVDEVFEKSDVRQQSERHLYMPGVRASFDLGLTVEECVQRIHKRKTIGHGPWPQ